MTAIISGLFEDHRLAFPARSPDLSNKKFCDEQEQIGNKEGMFDMTYPAPNSVSCGRSLSEESKYLWVIGKSTIRASIEKSALTARFGRGRLSHTNLTGGAEAHTAGELLFRDPKTVIINGGSSRYTPRSPEELKSVAKSFRSAGFHVASMGWDDEAGTPARTLRGSPEWIK